MGQLIQPDTGRRLTLNARVLVGRSSAATLHLPHPEISAEHAVIYWDGGRWSVRDLGSSNGTSINGQRLEVAREHPLSQGDVLSFGNTPQWVVDDNAPPVLMARRARDGQEVMAEDDVLCLPSEDDPQVMVVPKGPGEWLVERAESVAPIRDAETLTIGTEAWQVSLPGVLPSTWQKDERSLSIDNVTVCFQVSRDEEFVKIELRRGPQRIELRPSSHHYSMLVLARQRLGDVALPEAEQGWIHRDDLEQMLGLNTQHLNVHIFRMRKQLSSAGVERAVELVERRVGSGQLRIGTARLEVVPLSGA